MTVTEDLVTTVTTPPPRVYEKLSDGEACLYAILTDHSGLDAAEFLWKDESRPDACWRAWPFQVNWWRARAMKQIDQCARAIGKSESIMARALTFCFRHPGQEMVITAPEGNHVDAITDRIEERLTSIRLLHEMLSGARSGIKHKPFVASFANGARIMGRLPQKSGVGVKGCVGPGTLVVTRTLGLVPIEELEVGVEVLTHQGRWRRILATYRFDADETRVVAGHGHPGMLTSDNHRFWARENVAGPKAAHRLEQPDWFDVDDSVGAYWASPTEIPVDPLPDLPFEPEPLLWLAGAYAADGHIDHGLHEGVRRRFRSHFTVHARKADAVAAQLAALELNSTVHPHRDTEARRVEVSSKTLALWFEEHVGRGSHHKHLPAWLLAAPAPLRAAFLEGYLHGDGHRNKEKQRWELSSASKQLALGVKLLAQTLGHSTTYTTFLPNVTHIAGVELKAPPVLAHRVHIRRGGQVVHEGGAQWSRVKQVTPAGPAVVYDLAVEEDFSYVGDGIVHHNTHPVSLEMDECFPAGTLILTQRGLEPIESVVVGDVVWTHANRWRPVSNTWQRGVRPAVRVRGQGHPGLVCTPDHELYVRPITGYKDPTRRWMPVTSAPEWVEAHRAGEALWGSPVDVHGVDAPEEIPKPRTGPNQALPIGKEMLWVLGLWLTEGSISSTTPGHPGKVTWSVHRDEAPEVMERLRAAGLRPFAQPVQSSEMCINVVVAHVELARFLTRHCRKGAHHKQVPVWVLGLGEAERRAVLEGLVYGDGFQDPDVRYAAGRWKLTTVSKALAVSARLLALSLGYSVSLYENEGRDSVIRGRAVRPGAWYQVVGNVSGQGFVDDGRRWTRIREITPTEPAEMFDLEVEDDHSFVADGIVVSNSQDYPHKGWMEIIETLNRHVEGAEWRAHGVTKGVRDDFYEHTNTDDPTNDWMVHRFTAVHKPTFTDEERDSKIKEYGGSINSPDFRRNVYGLHGDATNPIFVLARFMACADQQEGSDYNTEEYSSYRITAEQVEDRVGKGELENSSEEYTAAIQAMLDFPASHQRYKVTWAGMDVGLTTDPSELLVFAEYTPSAEEKRHDAKAGMAVPIDNQTRFKLLTRIHLERIPDPLQADVIMAVIAFYGPKAFSLDRTGIGLPLLQHLQQKAQVSRLAVYEDPDADAAVRARADEEKAKAKRALTVIKGYNFSEKVVVEIDEEKAAALSNPTPQELAEKAGIKRISKDYSTDKLRELVDSRRLMIPWDKDIINQWNGQTWSHSQSPIDAYGNRRRSYSEGTFHCLVAGTSVTTADGPTPIEQVAPGTLVLTRVGWRPVVDAWMTNPAATTISLDLANGTTLRGTADHPVWRPGVGWVPLGQLRPGDDLTCLASPPRAARPSSSTASSSTGTRTQTAGPTGSTSRTAPSICTEPSGKRPMGQSQMGGLARVGAGSTSRAPSPPAVVTATTVVRRAVDAGSRPVYDLTVADAHEFFANGVLVHNCLDAGRMAAIGMFQAPIEQLLAAPPKKRRPVLAQFVT